jgi:hypothetical protein
VTHEDLVILTAWMADNGYDAHDIAYAVEKPHKYEDELKVAKAELDAEVAADKAKAGFTIWDDPDSPQAAQARREIHELAVSLRADREAGYPAEAGEGLTDTSPPPSLHLLRGENA